MGCFHHHCRMSRPVSLGTKHSSNSLHWAHKLHGCTCISCNELYLKERWWVETNKPETVESCQMLPHHEPNERFFWICFFFQLIWGFQILPALSRKWLAFAFISKAFQAQQNTSHLARFMTPHRMPNGIRFSKDFADVDSLQRPDFLLYHCNQCHWFFLPRRWSSYKRYFHLWGLRAWFDTAFLGSIGLVQRWKF